MKHLTVIEYVFSMNHPFKSMTRHSISPLPASRMASSLIDAPQEEPEWACISELASQLACVTNIGGESEHKSTVSKPYYTCLLRDPRLYTFSNQLIQALLHLGSKVDNRNIHQLLSILKQNSKRITQALDRSSLRCLAYLLLNSDVESVLKNGLYLLLDEPQYMRDLGHMVYQVASPTIGNRSQLLLGRILSKLYALFSTERLAIWLRKLAGKIFLEMFSEPEHDHTFPIESHDVDMSRLSYIILNGNRTLKLLAAIMIHALHNSGVSDEVLWPSDSSRDRVRFFGTLPSYRTNPLQHLYTFFNTKVPSKGPKMSKNKDPQKTSSLQWCFLLRSTHLDETPLTEGISLTTIDAGCLTFMDYRQDTTRVCLEYVEVHAQSIRLPVRTVVENPLVYRLMLSLPQPKSVLKNGRWLCFEGQVLSLLSDKDPSELQRAIEESCQNDRGSARTDAIFRRSSSIILELDTCEEIARKSSGFSPNNIQMQEGACTDPASIQRSGQMLDKGAEEIEEGNTTNTNLNLAHSRRNSSRQDCQQAHHAGESPVPISNPSMPRGVLRKPNGRFAPNPDTGGRRTSRLRSTNRGKVRRSNTQESMVIYARHPKQKVYTTNSKAAVDWDEDLRPSADEVKRSSKNAEITSISSPLPGETSFVGSRLAVPGKKRAAKGKKQTTKRKNISSRPAKSTGNNVKKVTTVPTVAEDADKSEDKVINKLSGDDTTGKLVLCSNKSGPRDVGKERIGTCAMTKCAHVELDSDNAIFGCDSAVPQHDGDRNRSLEGQAPGKNERSLYYQHQLSASEVGEDNSQENTPRCRPTARELQGRGRAVGNKLSAAFQQDDPLSGHSGHEENSLEHIQRQNKLTNEDKLVLSDTLYVSVGESGVQEQLELTESGVKRYTTYEGNSPFETPNINFTSKFDDDLYTGCSLQRHTNRGDTFKIDDEEQKGVFQSESPAASSPLRGEESHFDEEFDSEMCNETLGAAGDTCSSDMHERTSVDIESPRTRPEKRKIAALNPDYMQDGPTTGNHAAKSGFKKETRRFGRRDHMYPTKRLKGTPRSTIVDSDGSPRLLFHVMSGCMVHRTDMEDWTPTSEHVRGIMKDGKIGTHSDDLPALCELNVIPGSEHSATCTNKVKDVLTFQDRLMACAGKPTSSNTPLRNAAQSIPDARLTLRRDTKPHATCNSLPRVTVVSDQSSAQPNLHKSVITAEDVLENTSWQTSLQVLHKRAQGMLLATSEHIIQEIESEKKTINEVLEVYRRDCHRVLDQLFEAQDERIKLCQQQMNSIREHHTGVCQELMQRLERDEQRLQDRMQLRKMN